MERFRGTSDLPLTSEGLQNAHLLGQQLAARGGVDRILSSDLSRTQTTAKIINHYTRAPIVHVGADLHPWQLGGLEGQEVTPERIDFMNSLITQHPDYKIPGRGPISVGEGESFNDFKSRVLPTFDTLLREHVANPEERTAVVTHFRNLKLMAAWIRAGAKPTGEIDPSEMTQDGGAPGSMMRVHYDPYIGAQVSGVDEDSPQRLPGGIYLIRHEATPWNKPNNDPNNGSSGGAGRSAS